MSLKNIITNFTNDVFAAVSKAAQDTHATFKPEVFISQFDEFKKKFAGQLETGFNESTAEVNKAWTEFILDQTNKVLQQQTQFVNAGPGMMKVEYAKMEDGSIQQTLVFGDRSDIRINVNISPAEFFKMGLFAQEYLNKDKPNE